MDLGGRIIIVFILCIISIYLLDLKEPVGSSLKTILDMPRLGYGGNSTIYHLGKLCILLIAVIGILKILRGPSGE